MGVDDRVELTGWVSDAEYQSWMRRATVVVQLRTDTSGASSLAVTDALAHGIPTITSHGAFADVPAGTLRLVDPDISVVGLTDELAALLSDRAAREHMSAAALSYAKSWTFDDVAARLVEIANANLAP
jgi:glycosyltransferase involved in cell wall biosynthesis